MHYQVECQSAKKFICLNVKAPLTLVKINLFSIIFKAEVDLDNWLDSMWNLLSLNSVSMPFLFECHHSKCVYINRWIENKLNVVVLIVILGVVVPSVMLNVVVLTVVVLNVVMLNTKCCHAKCRCTDCCCTECHCGKCKVTLYQVLSC